MYVCLCLFVAVFAMFKLCAMCHGLVAGRTRETRGKRNNGILMKELRIHTTSTYIKLTDKDSGETQGL